MGSRVGKREGEGVRFGERERERERERRREGGSKGIRGKMVERPKEREERMIVKNNEGVLKKKTDVIQLSE